MKSDTNRLEKTAESSLPKILLTVLIFYLITIGIVLRHYEWNTSALIMIGSAPRSDVDLTLHPPHKGVVVFEDGAYDGQYYYWVARSPLHVLPFIDPYRYQRIILPLLAHLMAGGDTPWIPEALLLTNLLFIAGATLLVARHLKDRGLSPWWGLIVPLNAGMMSSLLTTLTEPSCLFFGALAFVLWARRRFGWAALALSIGMLAREITILFILPLFAWALWRREWRAALALCLTAIPFLGYQYYLYLQTDAWQMFLASERNLGPPLKGIWEMAIRLPIYLEEGRSGLLKYINFIPVVIFLLYVAVEFVRRFKEQIKNNLSLGPFTLLLGAQILAASMVYWGPWESITGIGRVISGIFLLLPFAWSEEKWDHKWGLSLMSGLLTLMGILRLFIAHPHPYHIT